MSTLFIVIKGLEELANQHLALEIIEAFSARFIPVSIVLNLSEETSEGSKRNDEFVREIVQFTQGVGGVVELMIAHESLDSSHRYLHLRRATDLRDRLQTVFGSGPKAEDVVSIYDLGREFNGEPFAYRAAGFRVHIDPKTTSAYSDDTSVEPFDWGILRISGGIHRTLGNDPVEAIDVLRQNPGPQLLVLNAENTNAEEVGEFASEWAAMLDREVALGRIIPSRPRDYLLQGNPGASKILALSIDIEQSGSVLEDVRDFTNLLDQIEIPYSFIGQQPPLSMGSHTGFCSTEPSDLHSEYSAQTVCFKTNPITDLITEESIAEIIIRDFDLKYASIGPRNDGRYHINIGEGDYHSLFEQLHSRPMVDGICMVSPSDIQSRFQRLKLTHEIETAKNEGQVTFTTIKGLRDLLAAPNPVIEHFWSTRRRSRTPSPSEPISTFVDREAFLDDARVAWSYIDRYTSQDTGLCAGTVQAGSATHVINSEVTLWDVASQLQGISAAQSLNLIARTDAVARIEKLLSSIPTISVDGHELPPAIFNANTLSSLGSKFDACDTGRFLIALQNLTDEALVSARLANSVLERWDLDAVVRDGHPFSRTQQGWVDTFNSHCTHYIRRGYAFAGIEVDTPYPIVSVPASGDERIELLFRSAELGHYGPEPALLETIEGQQSPEARYLGDVLFDAQLSLFESTGQVRCVSEVPISVTPWFVYQGLRVDLPDELKWVIRSTNSDMRASSDPALEANRMISTKAIYLWVANYSHAFTRNLLELARNQAKLAGVGFASGLYEDDASPMEGYSDLNTNGIILASIRKLIS